MEEYIIKSPILDENIVSHGFSTRLGGVSKGPYAFNNMYELRGEDLNRVAINKFNFLKSLGIFRLATLEQVHGNDVIYTNQPGEFQAKGDAIITTQRGLGVGVYTADCTPILLGAPKAVAAVHSGWRGTKVGVVKKAVKAMLDLGVVSQDIKAAIGPAIGSCCYEIGLEVAKIFKDLGYEKFVLEGSSRPHLDLRSIIETQLLEVGVLQENIWTTDFCTYCDEEVFYSYRRTGWPTGQMLSVISLK